MKKLKKAAFGSWKSTLVGFLIALQLIVPQLMNVIDGNPETIVDWNTIIMSIETFIFGVILRDNDVDSETAGVK
jgi:hypothetical protein